MQSSHPRSVHPVSERFCGARKRAGAPSFLFLVLRIHRASLREAIAPCCSCRRISFSFHRFARELTNGYATHGLRKIKAGASRCGAGGFVFGAPRPRFPMNGGCVNRASRLALGAPYTRRPRGEPSLHQHNVYRGMLYTWGEGKPQRLRMRQAGGINRYESGCLFDVEFAPLPLSASPHSPPF